MQRPRNRPVAAELDEHAPAVSSLPYYSEYSLAQLELDDIEGLVDRGVDYVVHRRLLLMVKQRLPRRRVHCGCGMRSGELVPPHVI